MIFRYLFIHISYNREQGYTTGIFGF